MTYDTINEARTVAGNSEGALLANRYRVVRQLGQGGMGSVWLAEDTQLDNRQFAIKMLPSILVSNKRAYRQLKDEALVAMQLVHPNIVQIRAFEENDGNPFLVMDYVDGQTLDDYLAENTGTTGVSPVGHGLPEAEVLRILRPIAAALDYAHSKGVVHRDVKPGNVMIAKDGTPYILDFGIAREIQETLTRVTGKLSSGTLLYMSPEQLMGESPKPAQDIYFFAAMVYECLKGEPPFSHGQIEFQIMNKQPAPLVTQTGNAAILAAGVMAGLAKKPEDRPASCSAVLGGRASPRAETGGRASPRAETGGRASPRAETGGRASPRAETGGSRPVAALKSLLAVAALVLIAVGGWWWATGRERDSRPSGITRTTATNETNRTTVTNVPSVPQPVTNVVSRPTPQPTWEVTQQVVNDAKRHVVFIRKRMASVMEETIKPYRAHAKYFDEILAEIDGQHEALKKLKDPTTIEEARKFTKDAETAVDEIENKCVEKLKKRLKFCVSEEIRSAKEFFSKSEKGEGTFWSEAIAAADRALALEPTNAEAKRLKADAESRLVPTVEIAIIVDGRALGGGETVKIGETSWTTPIKWGKDNIQEGRTYGGKVSYERGGRRYFGELATFTVNWRDPKSMSVTLTEYKGPRNGDTKTLTLPGGATMEIIYCEPGDYLYGDYNTPMHMDHGFWLGKYEVTQEQWECVMGENPSFFKGGNRPVENVSWDDCQKFIQKVNSQLHCGARLPTEHEWEYACRAGTRTKYSWGDVLNGRQANCDGNYPEGTEETGPCLGRTTPVGSYEDKGRNDWGFCDMHGNVWEWCEDKFGSADDDRVLRGGSWSIIARICRSAYRDGVYPGNRCSNYGFRLCCSAGPRE